MSAATRLRRLDENAEITVYEAGPDVSFANCGLPYFIGGVIGKRDSLLLQTPESLAARFNLDVRVNSRVTSIDRAAKTVTVHDSESDEIYTDSYDSLILAPGAAPRRLHIPGWERSLTLLGKSNVVRSITAPAGNVTSRAPGDTTGRRVITHRNVGGFGLPCANESAAA
jgi:NADPH-dependent 2,4-dienoyl-CoA reductase/sulfur reductase-like enzyme